MRSLPLIPKDAIREQSWIECPNCQQRHGLFYKRHDAKKRTLHFVCDKVERFNVETSYGDRDFKDTSSFGESTWIRK